MAGKGYFDWGDATPAELFRERDRRLLKLKQALRGIPADDGQGNVMRGWGASGPQPAPFVVGPYWNG